MSTSKIIVLSVLIAVFILLVAIDGRRKLKRKREQEEVKKNVSE